MTAEANGMTEQALHGNFQQKAPEASSQATHQALGNKDQSQSTDPLAPEVSLVKPKAPDQTSLDSTIENIEALFAKTSVSLTPEQEMESAREDRIEQAIADIYESFEAARIDKYTTRGFVEVFTKAVEATGKHPERKEDALTDIIDIATKGELGGEVMMDYTEYPGRFGPEYAPKYRSTLIDIYSKNPDLARGIVKDRIVGVHGSTSASFLGVADMGLQPHTVVVEAAGFIVTGEGVVDLDRPSGFNDWVCFAQWHDAKTIAAYTQKSTEISEEGLLRTIQAYSDKLAELEAKTAPNDPDMHAYRLDRLRTQIHYLEAGKAFLEKGDKTAEEVVQERLMRMNFPVAYFVQDPGKREPDVTPSFAGDIKSEFNVRGGMDKGKIHYIGVPKEHVEDIQAVVAEKSLHWKVFPLEDYTSSYT